MERRAANDGPVAAHLAGVRLDVPSLYRPLALREMGDAFAHARAIAAEEGAGTLVWVRRFDALECALVLEPEEPLAGARRALYAVMNAAADALAAHGPPEMPVTFEWPDTILVDGGIVGGVRLAWPDGTAETEIPEWLVAGLVIRCIAPVMAPPPGGHVLDTPLVRGNSLETAGFEMLDAKVLLESVARHLMAGFDLWNEKGANAVAKDFLARLPEDKRVRRGIDVDGDLLIRRLKAPADVERRALVSALATPQWLDPATGEVWL